MTDKPTRNIKQEKAISYFEQLEVMDMFECFEKMRGILDEAFEKKKNEFSDKYKKYNEFQEKIKAQ